MCINQTSKRVSSRARTRRVLRVRVEGPCVFYTEKTSKPPEPRPLLRLTRAHAVRSARDAIGNDREVHLDLAPFFEPVQLVPSFNQRVLHHAGGQPAFRTAVTPLSDLLARVFAFAAELIWPAEKPVVERANYFSGQEQSLFVPSLRDSVSFFASYPGLTPWAN
jgi:hypothetical protein